MTVRELFDFIKGVRPGFAFNDAQMMVWLNEIEGKVQTDIMLLDPAVGEDGTVTGLVEYDVTTDMDTELIVPFPWNKLYRYFMLMSIDLYNGEFQRYGNSFAQFNEAYEEYAAWYAQNIAPANGLAVAHGYYLTAYQFAVRGGFVGTVEAFERALSATASSTYLTGFVTPEQFGAVGDGEADDTAAVQAAINTGQVVLCCEDYRTTEALRIDQDNVKVYISGRLRLGASIIITGSNCSVSGYPRGTICVSSDISAIVIGPGSGETMTRNTLKNVLENLEINGSSTTYGAIGVDLRDPATGGFASYFHRILNCNFRYWDIAIQFTGEANANYIENVTMINCGTSKTVGAIHCVNLGTKHPEENMIKNVFHHFSRGKSTFTCAATTLNLMNVELTTEPGSVTGETTIHPYSVYIPNSTSCWANYFNIRSNSAGGNVFPDDYGVQNTAIINGNMWTGTFKLGGVEQHDSGFETYVYEGSNLMENTEFNVAKFPRNMNASNYFYCIIELYATSQSGLSSFGRFKYAKYSLKYSGTSDPTLEAIGDAYGTLDAGLAVKEDANDGNKNKVFVRLKLPTNGTSYQNTKCCITLRISKYFFTASHPEVLDGFSRIN